MLLMRGKGGPVKSGTTVTAVVAFFVLAGVMLASLPAFAVPGPGPKGYDVSYPQCAGALPSDQAFGIVAVNAGLANTTNPCLAGQISWALGSAGGTRQPRVSLYVNTADPGNKGVTDWPANNLDPLGHWHVTDPYGHCAGGLSPACAWQYGWNLAEGDAQSRGVPNPRSYRWWLDVETINSWQSGAKVNRADLEGMVSYLRHIGAAAGIYSTARQFGPLVGPVVSSSPLYRLPDWIPGANTLAQARKNCRLAPLTGGGTVTLAQWKTKPANSDYSCPAPAPPKAKGR
jgi:hypothetical protein